MKRSRDVFPLPRLSEAALCRFRSRRIQKRMSSVRKALGIANACIDALNELHVTRSCRTVTGPVGARCPRVTEILS